MWRHFLHFWSASWVLKSYSDVWQKKFILMMTTLKIWDWAIAVIQKMKMNIKKTSGVDGKWWKTPYQALHETTKHSSLKHPDDNLKALSLIVALHFHLHLQGGITRWHSVFLHDFSVYFATCVNNLTVCEITAWWIPFLWSKIRWSCALILYACPLSSHCAFIHRMSETEKQCVKMDLTLLECYTLSGVI